MSLEVLSPGLLSTIQDGGRKGYRKEGIGVGGAMDLCALQIANLLVGNEEESAALEICMTGPTLLFEESLLIAITGADLSPTLNNKPIKMWRALWVPKDSVLAFGAPVDGRFAYIAVAGGFDLPKVLGSHATNLSARFGGFHGRALAAGDKLVCKENKQVHFILNLIGNQTESTEFIEAKWAPDPQLLPQYQENPLLEVMKGPDWDLFTSKSRIAFLNEPFILTTASNRMGYRLKGPQLQLEKPKELLSTAVAFGTVQVPSNGDPIVLAADHQTTGGYPCIANVITISFSALVQTLPGKSLYFKEISLAEAQQQLIAQRQQLAQLKRSIHLKQQQPL